MYNVLLRIALAIELIEIRACLVRINGMELKPLCFKFPSFLFGDDLRGKGLETYGY